MLDYEKFNRLNKKEPIVEPEPKPERIFGQECALCAKMFDCSGKPIGVKRCNLRVERKCNG